MLEKVEGELAVGCDGWLEQEEVEELSGIRRMELPSAIALGRRPGCTGSGSPVAGGDLAYTMYPWVVSGSRLHDAGWRPKWTNEGGPRGAAGGGGRTAHGRRAAAGTGRTRRPQGAAGATVALLGAAVNAALTGGAWKARRRI